ncbi:MAG: hypothetical protein U1F50_09930 [Rubrivivax sp.]
MRRAPQWRRAGGRALLGAQRLHYAQICGGRVPGPTSTEAMISDARSERLLPGEGGIPLADLFACLPCGPAASVEVPSES